MVLILDGNPLGKAGGRAIVHVQARKLSTPKTLTLTLILIMTLVRHRQVNVSAVRSP